MDEGTEPTRDTAQGALDEAKDQARRAKDQVEHGAREALRVATDKAAERADSAAGSLVHEGKALASALRGAADQAERDGARVVHGALRGAATTLERWTDQASSSEPRQWLTKLEDLGRREPLALFGVAAAIGFIGTRALRAGAQARSTATPHRESEEGRT